MVSVLDANYSSQSSPKDNQRPESPPPVLEKVDNVDIDDTRRLTPDLPDQSSFFSQEQQYQYRDRKHSDVSIESWRQQYKEKSSPPTYDSYNPNQRQFVPSRSHSYPDHPDPAFNNIPNNESDLIIENNSMSDPPVEHYRYAETPQNFQQKTRIHPEYYRDVSDEIPAIVHSPQHAPSLEKRESQSKHSQGSSKRSNSSNQHNLERHQKIHDKIFKDKDKDKTENEKKLGTIGKITYMDLEQLPKQMESPIDFELENDPKWAPMKPPSSGRSKCCCIVFTLLFSGGVVLALRLQGIIG